MITVQVVAAVTAKLLSFQVSAACLVVLSLFYMWCCLTCFSLVFA